jgi:tetratricopeptide (TPR) repeat protein
MRNALALLAIPALLLGLGWSDSLYHQVRFRHHNRHLNHAWLDSLRMTLEQVRAQEPENESCMVWLSRVLLQLGDYSDTKAQKLKWYKEGRDVAAGLRELDPQNPEGYLWWANAQSRLGELQGVMKSLFMVRGIKSAFDRAVELKPGLTLGLYALGRYHFELPGIAGGNLDLAEQYWLKALALEPNLTLTHISLAWLYRRRKMWDKAREHAEAVLATRNPEEPATVLEHDKPEALKMLSEIPGE